MNVERKKKDARWCNATSRKLPHPDGWMNRARPNQPSRKRPDESSSCVAFWSGGSERHINEQWPLLGDIFTSTYSFIMIITIFWKPVIHTKLSQNQLCMQNVSLLIFFNAFCLTFNWITPTDSGQEKGGIKNHWAIIGCCWLLANQSVWDQRVQWVCFKGHMWASSTIPDAASLLAVGTNEQNVFYLVF